MVVIFYKEYNIKMISRYLKTNSLLENIIVSTKINVNLPIYNWYKYYIILALISVPFSFLIIFPIFAELKVYHQK